LAVLFDITGIHVQTALGIWRAGVDIGAGAGVGAGADVVMVLVLWISQMRF
jgi:hypothetical protein